MFRRVDKPPQEGGVALARRGKGRDRFRIRIVELQQPLPGFDAKLNVAGTLPIHSLIDHLYDLGSSRPCEKYIRK